jgi:hypothetical protein
LGQNGKQKENKKGEPPLNKTKQENQNQVIDDEDKLNFLSSFSA